MDYTNSIIDLLGVYKINEDPNVHLVELRIGLLPQNVDVSSFTQKNDALPESSWQVAYDEYFLSHDGMQIINPLLDNDTLKSCTNTRIAFFMYFIDFNKPLSSKHGEVLLTKPLDMPARLSEIIIYEPVN